METGREATSSDFRRVYDLKNKEQKHGNWAMGETMRRGERYRLRSSNIKHQISNIKQFTNTGVTVNGSQ